ASLFPRIAALAQSLDLLLLSCVDDVGRVDFDFDLRFQHRGGALSEWFDLQSFFTSLPAQVVTVGPAMVIWPLHPSSCFTISSFFSTLRRSVFFGVEDFPSRFIWKNEVPTKIQGFLWLVAHEESVSHIFLSCDF
ncbi:hypothetical protein LINGRAHAP2_LOCUS36774, partial [Linum grandiflorum]